MGGATEAGSCGNLSWTIERGEGRTVIRLDGELDLAAETGLRDAAMAALDAASGDVVCHMGGLSFMDSTGLRLLGSMKRKADDEGKGFHLAASPPAVDRVIDIAGLRSFFSYVDHD